MLERTPRDGLGPSTERGRPDSQETVADAKPFGPLAGLAVFFFPFRRFMSLCTHHTLLHPPAPYFIFKFRMITAY
jgi:hypothetical protein